MERNYQYMWQGWEIVWGGQELLEVHLQTISEQWSAYWCQSCNCKLYSFLSSLYFRFNSFYLQLLDACIKNSGKIFHIEVASREFETEITKVITKGHEIVSKKLRESLKRWAENEFKSDTQLVLIPTLYSKLKSQGYEFYTEEPVRHPNLTKITFLYQHISAQETNANESRSKRCRISGRRGTDFESHRIITERIVW